MARITGAGNALKREKPTKGTSGRGGEEKPL